MKVSKRNAKLLVLSVLVCGMLMLFSPKQSAQIECNGQCELALEKCLRGGLNSKSGFNP